MSSLRAPAVPAPARVRSQSKIQNPKSNIGRPRRTLPLLFMGCLLAFAGCKRSQPYPASQQAATLDRQLDWTAARLLVVQEGNRYKTLDALARESLAAMTGQEHLPGLSPLASLFEWLFNRDAYQDTPLVRVKESGLRFELVAGFSEDRRQRILDTGYFTPRELADPGVNRALAQAETRPLMRRAAGRLRNAQVLVDELASQVCIVPQPGGDRVARWFTPLQTLGSLSDEQLAAMKLPRDELAPEQREPIAGLTPAAAADIVLNWGALRTAWLHGDAAGVQNRLNWLCQRLPALAGSDVYPARPQRLAEVWYYRLGKFTAGWLLYFVAFLFSVPLAVTRWRACRVLTVILLLGGLAWHGAGVMLRWYILGHIPVTNMFEAVVGGAWLAVIAALLVEWRVKLPILLVAASLTGFAALVVAGFVLPGAELTAMPGILDHIQLRIHTVLISFSYVLIFLATIIALVYLGGYYWLRFRRAALQSQPGRAAPVVRGAGTSVQRPLLAGAAPGDEAGGDALPQWLNNLDWSQLIIINMVFVMLFVGGVIMGAMWADQSWGRPWGWDPKEVFALNTWIIYAVLIHIRFVARRRGLWTAWLSLAGCVMMAFNWFIVNLFIVSIHSYA